MSAAVDPTLITIVLRRPYVNEFHPFVFKQLLGSLNDEVSRDNTAGAVDDPFISVVAAHDVIRALQGHRRHVAGNCPGACLCVQKERPGFRIGLQRFERAPGYDQIFFSRIDVFQTMPAGHMAAFADPAFGRISIVINRAKLHSSNGICRQGFKSYGHGRSP